VIQNLQVTIPSVTAEYYYIGVILENEDFDTTNNTTGPQDVAKIRIPLEAPAPPTNILANQGTFTDKVLISWPPVDGATEYKV
jgi:hypothetical protein